MMLFALQEGMADGLANCQRLNDHFQLEWEIMGSNVHYTMDGYLGECVCATF